MTGARLSFDTTKGTTSMKTSRISFIVSITTLLLSIAAPAVAQTAVAPGADVPTTGLGAIAPGGVPIAPGAAAIGDTDIVRVAPGGTRLAPGPAGSLGTPLLSTPALPGARMR
jgi:hypothetical protein